MDRVSEADKSCMLVMAIWADSVPSELRLAVATLPAPISALRIVAAPAKIVEVDM
jgi:hypothetical protein